MSNILKLITVIILSLIFGAIILSELGDSEKWYNQTFTVSTCDQEEVDINFSFNHRLNVDDVDIICKGISNAYANEFELNYIISNKDSISNLISKDVIRYLGESNINTIFVEIYN